MGLGQISFYLSAAAASGHTGESQRPQHSGRIAVALRRAQARTAQFVELHGFSTIFTLSLFPNPLTTFASITAGAMGMGFRRFLPADFAGHADSRTDPCTIRALDAGRLRERPTAGSSPHRLGRTWPRGRTRSCPERDEPDWACGPSALLPSHHRDRFLLDIDVGRTETSTITCLIDPPVNRRGARPRSRR